MPAYPGKREATSVKLSLSLFLCYCVSWIRPLAAAILISCLVCADWLSRVDMMLIVVVVVQIFGKGKRGGGDFNASGYFKVHNCM